jgi:hypothetical protein
VYEDAEPLYKHKLTDERRVAMIRVGILPYSSDYCSDRLFDLSSYLNRDNSLQIWHDFRQSCRSLGWEVQTFDNIRDEFDVYLIAEPHPKKLNSISTQCLRRSIVQFWEPPDVAPEQYSKSNLKYIAQWCPVVFCCNEHLCQEYGFIHRPWYVDLYPGREKHITPAEDRKGVCMIATNKYNRNPSSKLDFRLKFVKRLAKSPTLAGKFDLYGRYWLNAVGKIRRLIPNRIADLLRIIDKILIRCERKIPWNSKLRTASRGVICSKGEVLSKVKFNVIIENMYWDGYVSEKIFDALQFGCIPIYFGAGDVDCFVPSTVFINGRSFDDPLDAIRAALSMTEQDVNEMVQKGQGWLVSEDFEVKYSRTSYLKTLQKSIAAIGNSKVKNEIK